LLGHLLRTVVFGFLHLREVPAHTSEQAPPS
jgi:hypothetical protein